MLGNSLITLDVISGLTLGVRADDIPANTLPSVPAASEYRLGPEDVIEVFVWKEPDLSTTVVVRPDGRISLPLANELEAGGKTVKQLQNEITKQLSRYLSDPMVNVMVNQIKSVKISVLGEVLDPAV